MHIAGHELVLESLLEDDGSKQTLKGTFNKTFCVRIFSTNLRKAQCQYNGYSMSFMTNGRKVTSKGIEQLI